jgi:DNA-binding IclR family transcriptional regulator
MVLTALLVESEVAEGQLIAHASVRSLAADLGLNKDTVARALVRLRHSHLVVHEAHRFELSLYRLSVPAEVIALVSDSSVRLATRHRKPIVVPGAQLVLLEVD